MKKKIKRIFIETEWGKNKWSRILEKYAINKKPQLLTNHYETW